jgi:hypothetical protein
VIESMLVWWAAVSLVAVGVWSVFALRANGAERRRRVRRARQIADAYRAQALVTKMDGEAWTYEDAAKHWEETARREECQK